MVMDEEIAKIKLEIIRNCDAALTEKILDLIMEYKTENIKLREKRITHLKILKNIESIGSLDCDLILEDLNKLIKYLNRHKTDDRLQEFINDRDLSFLSSAVDVFHWLLSKIEKLEEENELLSKNFHEINPDGLYESDVSF